MNPTPKIVSINQGADPQFVGIIALAICLAVVFALFLLFVGKYYKMKAERDEERVALAKANAKMIDLQHDADLSRIHEAAYRKKCIALENRQLLGLDSILMQPSGATRITRAKVVDGS